MAEKHPLNDGELDRLFGLARDRRPAPSDDLIARIMADAEARARPVAAAPPARRGFLRGLFADLGGWPAATGLVSAAVTGLAIGLWSPETLDTLSGGYLAADGGYELEDLMPSVGDILGEG